MSGDRITQRDIDTVEAKAHGVLSQACGDLYILLDELTERWQANLAANTDRLTHDVIASVAAMKPGTKWDGEEWCFFCHGKLMYGRDEEHFGGCAWLRSVNLARRLNLPKATP